jgi:CheY-like chemotaxis protein
MGNLKNRITILMVDDDIDDFYLASEAFKDSSLNGEIHHVSDCDDLMNYLFRKGKYSHFKKKSKPDLILLDLNMPKKDGREVLLEIKSDPDLNRIPIVIYTSSKEIEDITNCYELGATDFISKPSTYDSILDIIEGLSKYFVPFAESSVRKIKIPQKPSN